MQENITLSRPYAKAAFQYALDAKQIPEWQAFFKAAREVVNHSEVKALLNNPHITEQDIKQLILEVCKPYLNSAIENFVFLLAARKRLSLLPGIATLFNKYEARHNNTVSVDVTTVVPLDEGQSARLVSALEKRLQQTVQLRTHTDSHLLGGMLIRAGDFVIDNTLRSKLTRMKHALLN